MNRSLRSFENTVRSKKKRHKAALAVWVGYSFRRKDLEGYKAVEVSIASLVDDSIPPSPSVSTMR